ncbi:MAG: hypothetical protein ACOVLB_01640 [Candidatus Nanopelagicus sp.]
MAKKKPTQEEKTIPVEKVQEIAEQAAQEQAATQQASGNQVQVNVDFLKTTRVHIAMPCYGGMLTESTFMSYIKWANTARQLGIDWTLETMVNESLISRARNTLTAKFLEQPESTHLFFVDADIGWEPWHLLVLLNRDVDVIGGLYPMKTMPIKWVVNGFDGAEEGVDGLQEVSKAGTGFLLMKKHVFEKLNAHPAVKQYKNDIGLDPKYDKHLKTYFDTAVRQNRYYSEDWTFCENWRDLGGKIYVDKRVLLRHSGSYVFCMENQQHLMNTIGPMYVAEQQAKAVQPVVSTTTVDATPAPAMKKIASAMKKTSTKIERITKTSKKTT